jgi:MFS transporter, PAT family, beta-lactamase induction signal transducer AmpG
MNIKHFFSIYLHPPILKVWLFGFTSGLSLLLSGNTLNFWLAKIGVETVTIGLFALVALPYSLKFIIAPIVDRYKIPLLSVRIGHSKSWIVVSQTCLILSLISLGHSTPKEEIITTALLGLLVALAAVIQDIILDAYRVKLLKNDLHKGPGSAMFIFGYRSGMLLSGAGAIYLSHFLEWKVIYLLMSLIIFTTMLAILFIHTPKGKDVYVRNSPKSTRNLLYKTFIQPFEHFGSKSNFIYAFSFILLYKLADNMISVMGNLFLLDMGYNEIEIAMAAKFFSVGAGIVGGFLSGIIITEIGISRSLLIFGIVHMLTHALFFVQAQIGYNIIMLYTLIGCESFTAGMAMTAYIAYMTSLCKAPYVGTQYALMSSMMGISRSILPAFSGFLVEYLTWSNFFILVILLSIPGLLLIPKINKIKVHSPDEDG